MILLCFQSIWFHQGCWFKILESHLFLTILSFVICDSTCTKSILMHFKLFNAHLSCPNCNVVPPELCEMRLIPGNCVIMHQAFYTCVVLLGKQLISQIFSLVCHSRGSLFESSTTGSGKKWFTSATWENIKFSATLRPRWSERWG